ncbi:MAG TPA: hypothetical protein VKR52_11250 [Terracidiphilus sp.]|nr:hypothetical protein [Terracidiphilus sp.]
MTTGRFNRTVINMDEPLEKIEVAAKKSWPVIMGWVGGITALIAFFGSIGGGITWLINHHRHNAEYKAQMQLAQTQASQKQYQAALKTYGEILKEDPLDRAATDAQLDAAMEWVEDFSLYAREGKDQADLSSAALDEIFPVLTSGMTRAKNARLADAEAHLGWAHFLNAKMAQRESDSVAVEDWRQALATDPANVYANAMLGNWLLQTGGNLNEAVQHFETAVKSGRALPLVRRLQLGGLLYLEAPGARAETMRVANDMRTKGEQLDPGMQRRVANWCFDPILTHRAELIEVLGAVPSDDAWKTYLWLESSPGFYSPDAADLGKRFVHANLLEIAGKRGDALDEYRGLQSALRDRPGSLRDQVAAAINRLTRG